MKISISIKSIYFYLSSFFFNSYISTHRSLTDDRFNKNVTKKCGWVIVGFFSYFTNLLRAKSDLLGLSNYIDFSISHVNSHLRNWSVFGFFAFIWMHWRPLVQKKYPQYDFRSNFTLNLIQMSEKLIKFTDDENLNDFTKFYLISI